MKNEGIGKAQEHPYPNRDSLSGCGVLGESFTRARGALAKWLFHGHFRSLGN